MIAISYKLKYHTGTIKSILYKYFRLGISILAL